MKSTTYPVVALIEDGSDYEQPTTLSKNGEYAVNESSRSDLFFVPQKHEGWVNIYKSKYDGYELSQVYQRKEDAESEKYINDSDAYITTTKIEWEE